jgi:3'-phosphoadenosine 5'-phosphosulfate sulfotransferase (PAPS reductase)/FAD synthetase
MTMEDAMRLTIPSGHESSILIVSMSGGKDSTATALRVIESGLPARYVFADTGWEAQETYDYLDMLRERLGITIDVVSENGGMVGAIRARAGFPARKQRWCTRMLKVNGIRAYHDALMEAEGVDTVSVVGIRAEESTDRAKMPVFGFDDLWGGYVWRPMIAATIEDVLTIHHRHGIPVNPLYRKGFSRVGCNPCIYATKEEIALTAEHFPQRINQIRELESECTSLRLQRNEVEPDRYEHEAATFFQAKMVDHYTRQRMWVPTPTTLSKKGKLIPPKGRLSSQQEAPPADAKGPGSWRDVRVPVYKPMGIDDIVSWSHTSRGGRQLKVIREEPEGGCFRWGMCEAPTKETAA